MKTTFGALGSLLRIAAGVRLRREHFGGIAFATGTGTTVDVDRPVFTALDNLRQRGVQGEEALVRQLCGGRNDAHQLTEAQRLLSQLVDLAILAPASEADMKQAAKPESPEAETANHSDVCWPSGPHLAAPVTVHWAVTHQCTLRCPECYVRRYAQGFSEELTLPESLRLVKILADWGVFELAIGGGEPLEFPLLPAIVKEARRQGLVVHVTTGWHHVPAARLAELAEGITGLQIGVKADRLLASPSTEAAVLARTAAAAAQAGLHIGANLILSKQTLPHFDKLLELLQQAGLTNVTLLRYKPPADVAEWRRAKPPVKALREFESRLPEVLRRHPQIALRLDCAEFLPAASGVGPGPRPRPSRMCRRPPPPGTHAGRFRFPLLATGPSQVLCRQPASRPDRAALDPVADPASLPPVPHQRGLPSHGLRSVCREGPLRRMPRLCGRRLGSGAGVPWAARAALEPVGQDRPSLGPGSTPAPPRFDLGAGLHAAVWRWPEAGDRGVACLRLSSELGHRTQAVRHLPGPDGRRDWRHPGFDWIHSRRASRLPRGKRLPAGLEPIVTRRTVTTPIGSAGNPRTISVNLNHREISEQRTGGNDEDHCRAQGIRVRPQLHFVPVPGRRQAARRKSQTCRVIVVEAGDPHAPPGEFHLSRGRLRPSRRLGEVDAPSTTT